MILALTCTGATVEMIAAAGGVTPSTLRNWLTRKDHAAYRIFQEAFAAAETYAAYVALKSIMEGLAVDPKLALEFLARRYPDQWGRVEGQDRTGEKREGDTVVLTGIKADLGSMLERVFLRLNSQKHNGPLSIDPGPNGIPLPKDPRPPREANGHP